MVLMWHLSTVVTILLGHIVLVSHLQRHIIHKESNMRDRINDEQYEFDIDSVVWPDIQEQTKGAINSAYRVDNELYLEIRRYYTYSCSLWDTGDYHDIVW